MLAGDVSGRGGFMAKEVRVNKSDQTVSDIDPVALEAVELELTLQSAMPFKHDCDTAVREALGKTGGHLLFGMNPDADNPDLWVGAVLFGTGDEAHVGLVTISEAEGLLSVETAERSNSPIARIAPAYAAVMAHLQVAA